MRARGAWLLLWLGVALITVGCGNIAVADELATRLQYEGNTGVTVSMWSEPDADVVRVTAQGNRTLRDEVAATNIGLTVWSTLPRKFDRLEIRVGQYETESAYQQLGMRYGPRDRALDNRTIAGNTARVLTPLSIAGGVLLLGAGVAALYVRWRGPHGQHGRHGRHELNRPSGHDAR